jgi:hypothetical protein
MKIFVGCVLVGLLAFTAAHADDDSKDVNSQPIGVPIIQGIVEPGQVLSADVSAIKDADGLGVFKYRWYRNGKLIKGKKAKRNTYSLKPSDLNYRISVRVRYVDGGGTKETLFSAETLPVAFQQVVTPPVVTEPIVIHTNSSPTGVPVILGTARQGLQLTADASGISDADGLGTFYYQWQRGGSDISDATNPTYLLGQIDVGRKIKVSVRYVDGGGTAEKLTSKVTSTVENINDNPVGLPGISGSLIQGAELTVVTSGITDADGLGSFSYQWRRGGDNIVGEAGRAYTLVQADVGKNISVFVSYTDGGLTEEGLLSKDSAVVSNVNDAGIAVITGQATDGSELMLDRLEDADGIGTDNITYQWMRTDPDRAGSCVNTKGTAVIVGAITEKYLLSEKDLQKCISLKVVYTDDYNVDEVVISNAKGPIFPDVPKVTPPAVIERVNATGWFTYVDLNSEDAVASDALDGSLTPVSNSNGYFRPGKNIVTWSATDSAGNVGSAEQVVNVVPIVQVSKMQVGAEGSGAEFKIYLNGDAVRYPVIVPYVVSDGNYAGAADNSDHNLVSANAIIKKPGSGKGPGNGSGKLPEVSIPFNIVDDGLAEGTETINVALAGSPDNAVLGTSTEQVIQIIEGNVPPVVRLEAPQMLIASDSEPVSVIAMATDANDGDTLAFDWVETDNALGTVIADDVFEFISSGLLPGFYKLHVTVDDEIASVKSTLLVNVLPELPALSADTDSDADDINDAIEGYGDNDGDGIADYLDAIQAANVIQILPGISDKFIMQTEPGLKLSLGEIAFKAGRGGSLVEQNDVTQYSAGEDQPQDTVSNIGGYFDFTVSGLSVAGQAVQVVIPQIAAMPRQSVYRKLVSSSPSEWQDFVLDANNNVASAAGVEGYCPPPNHQDYKSGLHQGYWCLQLTIEDGGPNDSDGVADLRITDPGGIGQLLSEVNVSSSSGIWNPLLAVLSILTIIMLRNNESVEKKAA